MWCRTLCVLWLVGCRFNFDGLSTAEALGGDSGTDAGDVSGVGEVALTAYTDGAPRIGVDVLFHDASGALLATVATDSTGRASAVVPAGSMVTLVDVSIEQDKTSYVLETILGVMPGDELVRGVATPPAQPDNVVPTLPGVVANAVEYVIDAGCGGVTASDPAAIGSFEITGNCAPGGTFDVLAVARDSKGLPLAYSYRVDLPYVAGGTMPVVMPAWRTDWITTPINLTGIPQGTTLLFGGALELRGQLSQLVFEGAFPVGGGIVPVPRPSGYGTGIELIVAAVHEGGATGVISRRSIPASTNNEIAIDLSVAPRITSVTLEEAARPRLDTTLTGPVADLDIARVELLWQSNAIDVWWLVDAPPEMRSVELPELPTAYAQAIPTPQSIFTIGVVAYYAADFLDGYTEVRQQSWRESNGQLSAAPADAEIVVTQYAQ